MLNSVRSVVAGILAAAVVGAMAGGARAADEPVVRKFSFGPAEAGYTMVGPKDVYSKEKGYGIEGGSPQLVKHDGPGVGNSFMTAEKPFLFSVAVPEGNYRVTLTVGDSQGPTDLTVKAELRRLMIEHVHLDAGKTGKVSFVVNVRTPVYAGGVVKLKVPRETVQEARAWDDRLTIEFNNAHPNIQTVEVEKVDVPTIYILGDSTVCDQSGEPWNSWGQTFPRFFKDDIAVSNQAESGETVASSIGANRFKKVFSTLKAGDYVFFQFGHNDMKSGTEARYKETYISLIKQIKEKGATPVVVSSMERKNGVTSNTLRGYPEAALAAAAEEKVPSIDLHSMSQVLYKGLGEDLGKAFQDGTHHNNFGSYEVSKCVLEGVRKADLDLMKHVRSDVGVFDPSKPDKADAYKVPVSAGRSEERPLGD